MSDHRRRWTPVGGYFETDFDDDGTTREPSPVATRRFLKIVGRASEASETIQTHPLNLAASWLAEQFQKLVALRSLDARWESSGANPPNTTAIGLASEVLRELSEIDLPPSYIDPSTDEGVCISFRNADRYADIECFNSGDVLAVITRDDADPVIWEVPRDQVSQAVAKISRFILG